MQEISIMKKILLVLALTICVSFCAGTSWATIIDFEDLSAGVYDALPDNYGGFYWSEYAYYMTRNYINAYPGTYFGTGYDNGIIGNAAVITRFEEPIFMTSTTPFNFIEAKITAAWNTNQNVILEGWLNGTKKYSNTVTVDYTDPLCVFDFFEIDTLNIIPDYSTGIDAGFHGGGHHIVIDNITYSSGAVPEPSSFMLMGFGGIITALIKRRRKA